MRLGDHGDAHPWAGTTRTCPSGPQLRVSTPLGMAGAHAHHRAARRRARTVTTSPVNSVTLYVRPAGSSDGATAVAVPVALLWPRPGDAHAGHSQRRP